MNITKKITDEILLTTKCLDKRFKCTIFPKTKDTFVIPEKTHEIYTLNQRIYELTFELWNNILTIIREEEFAHKKNICFDIFNPENCDDLNIHYHNFIENLIFYQEQYFDSTENENQFLLLKDLSNLLLNFLKTPFFVLVSEIKHLLIRIQKPDMSSQKESYLKLSAEKDFDSKLIQVLISYLQFLSDLLDRFGPAYEELKLNDLKKKIKQKIQTMKIQKMEFLERLNTYKSILNPKTSSYSTSTTQVSADNSITSSIITEQSSKAFQTEQITSISDFPFDTHTETNYSTKQLLKTFDNNVPTQSLNFLEENYEDALEINNSAKQNKNECLRTTDNWIIFGCIFSILFFIAILVIILIVFVMKKYKLKKIKIKTTESIQLENEPFYSVPIHTN